MIKEWKLLWVCVYDRGAFGVTGSVGRASVRDGHSVLRVFTLNKTVVVWPSALLITTWMDSTADAAVLDVWHALDLPSVTASHVWNTRSTLTLHTELKMCGYAVAPIAHFQ